jgi:hypothetical protein
MDTLVVKIGTITFELEGSRAELIELIELLSSTSFRVECGFEAGLTILAKRFGTYSYVLADIKNVLLGEMFGIQKNLNDTDNEEWIEWSEKGFDKIDFNQEVEAWTERLPK